MIPGDKIDLSNRYGDKNYLTLQSIIILPENTEVIYSLKLEHPIFGVSCTLRDLENHFESIDPSGGPFMQIDLTSLRNGKYILKDIYRDSNNKFILTFISNE